MKAYSTRRASEVYCSDFEETMLPLFSSSEVILLKVKLPGVRQLFTKMKPFLSEYFQSKIVRFRLGCKSDYNRPQRESIYYAVSFHPKSL